MDICVATEDPLSEIVAERLLLSSKCGFHIDQRFCKGGNQYLKSKLDAFCRIAKFTTPVLLLTDLDQEDCAPTLVRTWRGKLKLPDKLLFRVAVKETEAWLLADAEGFAYFSGVPFEKIPHDPENERDPKQKLLDLVRLYGKKKVKADLLPAQGAATRVGLGYNQVLCEFVRTDWSPERAELTSSSLARARQRISELAS